MECIDPNDDKWSEDWVIFPARGGCRAFKGADRVYLLEWTGYLIEGKDLEAVLINGKPAKRLKNGFFLVSFGNFVGFSNLTLKFRRKVIELPVEVLSLKVSKIYPGKFSSLRGHWVERLSHLQNIFVNVLTGDVLQYSSTIPFHLESPTEFSTVESEEPINELFAYHYLRSNSGRIISAFETVLHRIEKKLIVENEWLRADEVNDVTLETLLSIVQHPDYLSPAGEGVLIAEYLDGYAPTRVLGTRKYESPDTPENRFVKYLLNLLIEWGERVIGAFENENIAGIDEIRELLGKLEFIAMDGVWDDVGDMIVFPHTSQTLLKGNGYRDLLELYREFTAYVPFFEELGKAIDNKDIAKLYEYWCFFKLVGKLGNILGSRGLKLHVTPLGELSERGDVYAEFDNGWRLYYNKRLVPRKWSYSVTLRPDFSLFTGNPTRRKTQLIGVFDAKFKLDVVDEKGRREFDKETETAEKTGSYETWAKLEDIYKMHTYRDALGAKFAVVLYPGNRNVFFDKHNKRVTEILLEKMLTGNIQGVGYLSFTPEVKE
ncbi:hypothetical protein A3L09_10050 [Thermococcus profundus]|uniref:DUF2357 domain-containing protein n=1 Tax=Thermococcus profundus TaxID=49899 RepID=A0A2Z2MFQ1_THEPR|nr:DUF2357 domain-containing protein [Thermococcus profundus]ASJ03572.1 hypothetical protein A3L09_10050 [Thermococcus profundus]